MKSGEGFSRRKFLKTLFFGALILPFLNSCQTKIKGFLLKITGTNHVLGHRLWAKNFPKPTEFLKVQTLIVGGGISGLSAARYLSQHQQNDFLICELEDQIGGNSRYGQNEYSLYPKGAHYLPIPNKEDLELIDFLKENEMYLGDDENGEPILDDYQLVFPQQERFFVNNQWVSDLVYKSHWSPAVKAEFERFSNQMKDFKSKKDSEGKYYFTIPIRHASVNDEVIELERMTFKNWLLDHNYQSTELFWYLNYACMDDYGLGIDYVSAWAGIHYFSARKGNWSNTHDDRVFTWPEGNGRLVKYLSKHSVDKTLKRHLVYEVNYSDKERVDVYVWDDDKKISKKIECQNVIFSSPQFVNQYLFKDRKGMKQNYVPWLLATVTLQAEFGTAEELAWDNIIYGTQGLGYIYDQHQNLSQNVGPKVITYYRSFSSADSKKSRKKLLNLSEAELKQLIIDDLKLAHNSIEEFIIAIEFNKIGHAMVAPTPNLIFSEEMERLRKPIQDRIFFAHTDLSGVSIFEEAFHQGIEAAKLSLK